MTRFPTTSRQRLQTARAARTLRVLLLGRPSQGKRASVSEWPPDVAKNPSASRRSRRACVSVPDHTAPG